MCSNPKRDSGFTLLELMVAIAIAGVLMAIAIPSFREMIRNNRLTTYANEFVTSLNIARSEAVKRGVPVTVRKIAAAGTSTHWGTSGWNVFVDNGAGANTGNGVLDAGEEILRTYPAFKPSFSLIGNGTVLRDRITYQADGTINNTPGSFALCDNSDGNNAAEAYTSRLIIVNSIGRIQMGKDSDSDGIPEKNNGTPLSDCTSP